MHVTPCSSLGLALMFVAACFVDPGNSGSGLTNSGASNSGASNSGASTSGASDSDASDSDASDSDASNAGSGDAGSSGPGTTSTPTSTGDPGTGGTATTTTDPESGTSATSECGPRCCGDGVVDPGEACDEGVGAENFCTGSCQRVAYRVFVTSEGAVLGEGLSGADGRCQSVAQMAGLPGSYRAWLSSTQADAATRITHASVRPILRVDLEVVAESAEALAAGALLAPIRVSESGALIAVKLQCGEGLVWTGTNSQGALGLSNCDDWTLTEGGAGQAGHPEASDETWTEAGCQVACSGALRLYCFEVDA
jgi:hypothetical protein